MSHFSSKKSEKPHAVNQIARGKAGEDVAQEFLENHGFKILSRNFRCKSGEIDLVAIKKEELHFVEVKTRFSLSFGSGLEAVTPWKIKRMMRAAHLFLHGKDEWKSNPRVFSVIVVDMAGPIPQIEFFPNAFEAEGEYY